MEMAFKLLTSGRSELISQALPLLPAAKLNAVNDNGLTALMLACISGDEAAVLALVDAGADLNVETPVPTTHQSSGSPSRISLTSGSSHSRNANCQSPAVTPNKSLNLSASSGSLSASPNQNNSYQPQTSPLVIISASQLIIHHHSELINMADLKYIIICIIPLSSF